MDEKDHPLWRRAERAARSKTTKSLRELATEAADLNEIRRGDGWGMLHEAASIGNEAALMEMISMGLDVDVAAKNGATPLHAAARTGKTGALRILLKAGSSLEKVMVGGNSERPLHLALRSGNSEAAMTLLEAGADWTAESDEGDGVYYAVSANKGDILDKFVNLGADLRSNRRSLVGVAARKGHFEMMERLIAAGVSISRSQSGELPLSHAIAGRGGLKFLTTLLDAGANPNGDESVDDPPICFASSLGRGCEMVRELALRGADPNCADIKGRTPLLIAVHKDLQDNMDVLLEFGANPLIKDKDGYSALSLAVSYENWGMAAKLAKSICESGRRDWDSMLEDIRVSEEIKESFRKVALAAELNHGLASKEGVCRKFKI